MAVALAEAKAALKRKEEAEVPWCLDLSREGLGFPKMGGTPIAGWFLVENAMKMDDDWG